MARKKNKAVTIRTATLYGIFVSAKSYLMGRRCLVKRAHANMLAKIVAGGILPQELVDEIADYVYDLECKAVTSKWDKNAPFSANQEKFRVVGDVDRPAEAFVAQQLSAAKTGIDTVFIESTKPGREPGFAAPYMHISCVGAKPAMAMSLPNQKWTRVANSSRIAAIQYHGTKGRAYTACTTNHMAYAPNASRSVSKDLINYFPYKTDGDEEKLASGSEVQTSRLLQVCDIEKAMREWDAEAIRKYAKLLGLHEISFDGRSELKLKPGLHVWQTIMQ